MDQTPEQIVKGLVDSNPRWFESLVLATVAYDARYFLEVVGVINVDAVTGAFTPDFSTPQDNALYHVIRTYNQAMTGGGTFRPISLDFAGAMLKQMSDQAQMVSETEIPYILQRLSEVLQTSSASPQETVRLGLSHWLKKRRMLLAYNKDMLNGEGNVDGFLENVRKQVVAVDTTSVVENMHEFGAGVRAEKLKVERIQSSMIGLDQALGGGWGKKEAYLIIAATGVGKTVCAVQLATDFANGGAKGVLISTEQPHDELEVRGISDKCGIPFHLIKDGFSPNKLQPDQAEKYDKLVRVVGSNLLIIDWLGDQIRSVETDLEKELERARQKLGRVDFMILDWLGGAIGQGSTDKDKLRLTYQNAADKMARLARSNDMVTISFAQAHPSLGYNRVQVDSSCLAENKSLGRNMSGIIGITGFRNEADTTENSQALYQDLQWFYISKGRKSEGGKVKFTRQFNYQRINCPAR